MKVSAVLSIHNRSRLFERALFGYMWQTMPRRDWEIVLVDDMSTEDLSRTYAHALACNRHGLYGINLTHVKIDHTRHSIFKKRNPDWNCGDEFRNWYHTPAISINVGLYEAQGEVICLCHPEILHAPQNFEVAYRMLMEQNLRHYLFGQTYLGTQEMNQELDLNPAWTGGGWDAFKARMGGPRIPKFADNELYWYTSFLPRQAAVMVGGVDFEFLNGAAGEDDDFKDRVALAGWSPYREPGIEGFHQDHSDETEPHRNRNCGFWEQGLKTNRALLQQRRKSGKYPQPANDGLWWASECVVEKKVYTV